MEVIRIDGYTEDEKVAIARHHLLPRQVERNGLRPDEVAVTDDALRVVVADYTREAGVRNLERELGKLLRKAATTIASGDGAVPITVDATDVRGYLGRPRFFFEVAERTAVPGVCHGPRRHRDRRRCPVHRANRVEGEASDGFTLTGQLGDVMKESAQNRAVVRAGARGRARDRTRAGARAVPPACRRVRCRGRPERRYHDDDGLVSLLTDVPVRPSVGMTGG
jgi:ATP-dependent Lon protease